ncbi:uncharacterized protein EDB91DRAFT_256139 [Suillus paluster]|uniref:uncharacterized protein n=1 Tax=Suillus paluster TaxID=48578 RepID=UPI001B87806C|nr:uncharacterized protein EDB91DRAFT_256139 [Suillus paluster]KAG1754843.1 hypothetical protein EDB91DRAFT_256139 [Suillus paluster]
MLLPSGGAEDRFSSSAGDGSSSSGISFTTGNRRIQDLHIEENHNQRYRPYKDTSLGFDRDFETLRQPVKESGRIHVRDVIESHPPPAFHQLKKSLSHSTLQKAKLGSSGMQDLFRGDKGLKKQHSFHRSRVHTPPTSTPASPSTPLDHDSLSVESHKPSFPRPQPAMRKRMFSGSSRRPSTAITDEDLRSVFSLPSSHLASPKTVASLLDEPSSEPLASGMVTYPVTEFTPQYIMSPAEMLKVEAIVQGEFDAKYGEALRNPQRSTFAPTPMYGTSYTKAGLRMAPTSFPRLAPTRSTSNFKGPTPRSSARPSTAQPTSYSTPTFLSSTLPKVGLSPPPRLRARPRTAETMYHEDLFSRQSSNMPFISLSPPPPRPKCPTRAPSLTGDTTVPQRSVIRKPSFLEIADDTSGYEGSFLDFDSGKESLDLSRDLDCDDDDRDSIPI